MDDWPSTLNADSFFLRDRLAEGREDRVALRVDDGVVTYAEVDAGASGFARLLLDRGVSAGDRVLIVLPDGVDVVAALFLVYSGSEVVEWAPRVIEVADDFEPPETSVETAETAPTNPAIWLFSGGTAGVPKAVVQTHKSLVNTTRLYGQGSPISARSIAGP